MRVLHTSAEIHREIFRIFRRTRQRRVALVAYVGKGAVSQLPSPKGLELYCWPQAPGTHPDAVKKLQDLEAKVYFAKRLHMKVYWSELDGAVIGSANLSDNAFGVGDLREAAVAVPSSRVDIDRLVGLARGTLVDDDALDKLRTDLKVWNNQHAPRESSRATTFGEWYDRARHERWKWDYVNATGATFSRRAKEAVRRMNPAWRPYMFNNCSRGAFEERDWILRCTLTNSGLLVSPHWIYVDCVVLVEKTDRAYDPDYPFQAVQAREPIHNRPPPFRITPEFKRALRATCQSVGKAKTLIQAGAKYPTAAFLRHLRAGL